MGFGSPPRSSAFQFDPNENDARAVGEKLSVKTVLEGSVRTAGNRVRVSVQLVDVENGFQLWADRFDREMDDIFALQDEISGRVVEALEITLGGAAIEEPGRPTDSMDAYHLFLKGQHNWYKREKGALEKAASFFEQAANKDPSYALAHCGVVNAYSSLALYGLDPDVARVTADAALKRAFELAPGDAGTRAALGLKAAYLDWDWVIAEREFTAAIEAEPSHVLAHCWHSIMLSWTGRGEEAVAAAERALKIDPLSPYTNTSFGLALLSSGRPDEAHQALLESLDIDSDHLYSMWMMTSTLGALGHASEAVAVAEKGARLSGRNGFYRRMVGVGLWNLRATRPGTVDHRRASIETRGQLYPTARSGPGLLRSRRCRFGFRVARTGIGRAGPAHRQYRSAVHGSAARRPAMAVCSGTCRIPGIDGEKNSEFGISIAIAPSHHRTHRKATQRRRDAEAQREFPGHRGHRLIANGSVRHPELGLGPSRRICVMSARQALRWAKPSSE